MDYKPIQLTHAQLKTVGTVFAQQVFGIFPMTENKTTCIVGPGGAVIYVLESVEEVTKRVTEQGGQVNGISG